MALTYSSAGVDRRTREEAKKAWKPPAGLIRTPFNVLYHVAPGLLQTKCSDGVGTKVLLAQLAGKHDTVGIDAIAMVANDCIRCGALPLAFTDTIDIRKSTPALLRELAKGLNEGARQARAPIVAGETADVPELLSCEYHINTDCVGNVEERRLVDGSKVRAGDVVIGIRSSGFHSNGFSLVRKALFRKWGGKYDAWAQPDGLDRELVLEALEPTRIYVGEFRRLREAVDVKAAIHVTGDAYLKFGRLKRGFEFTNFSPQPVFRLLQKAGRVSDAEMLRTFNMGWGFAVVVDKADADDAIQALGSKAEAIGRVVTGRRITAVFNNKRISLK